MEQPMQKKVFLGVGVAVVLAGILFWWWSVQNVKKPAPPTATTAPTEGGNSLGEDLLEKAKNPLSGKVDTVNPVAGANPIEGAYQNPFQ